LPNGDRLTRPEVERRYGKPQVKKAALKARSAREEAWRSTIH
jgi:hypothetical protein